MLEATIKGRDPIAVIYDVQTAKNAVVAALDKLKTSLKTILRRMQNNKK